MNWTDQDPDYTTPGTSTNTYHQQIYEDNAREQASRKITAIIENQFSREIVAKEKEILQIQQLLNKTLKTLHFLRYIIISDFYNRKQCSTTQHDIKQTRIHPAIQNNTGKSPKCQYFDNHDDLTSNSSTKLEMPKAIQLELQNSTNNQISKESAEPPRKIPRYIPPKLPQVSSKLPSRGIHNKIRKRIIVGNISKWIPPDWREDAASHKWTMYVRTPNQESDIAQFVSKVRFFLHPSYQPNDVVDVTSTPFHLSRRGWGEFPLRVQLHFKNSTDKPMDIIHHLKLDKTYTGLQTLGSETIVDIWVNKFTNNCQPSITNNTPPIVQNINIDMQTEQAKTTNYPQDPIKLHSHVHREHDYANFAFLHLKNDDKIVQNSISNTNNISTLSDSTKLSQNNPPLLQPLEITIPSPFSPSGSKTLQKSPKDHVSFIKNNQNKLIRVNPSSSQKLVSLLKKSNNSINLKLNPSKTIILNSNSDIPVLKIFEPTTAPAGSSIETIIHNSIQQDEHAARRLNNIPTDITNCQNILTNNLPSNENTISKLTKTKVTIGKDRTKLNCKREFYQGILKTLKSTQIHGPLEATLRFIAKRIPIISPHFGDPDYKRLHPYVCGSQDEFLSFSIAKRRALEWYRAKQIRSLLKQREILEENIWSVKEIMIWCRIHGYTPNKNYCQNNSTTKSPNDYDDSQNFQMEQDKPNNDNQHYEENTTTCTQSEEFLEWVQQSRVYTGSIVNSCQNEQIIDVVEIPDTNNANRMQATNTKKLDALSFDALEIPKNILPMYSYVCTKAREIGVKLEPEQLVEGVMHGAAGRVLTKAVECLFEDLLRSSLAECYQRNGVTTDRCPDQIELQDVKKALMHRREFDIFTNYGLGTHNDNENSGPTNGDAVQSNFSF